MQQMSYEVGEEVGLNESKFLSEQVNYDEDPTQEQIIEKAEQLGIDDFGMARDALLKQLDPEWRPYINRHGKVFYINLEEKKGYVDHPVDMYFRIHYALRNKKKIPTFQQFNIEQISEDPRIIMKEINNFKVNQSLNIVYEQSQEESVKKNTKRSEEDQQLEVPEVDVKLSLSNENQLHAFRDQMEEFMNNELKRYKLEQEKQFQVSQRRYQAKLNRLKAERLSQLAQQFQKQLTTKNQHSFEKSVEQSQSQFDYKLTRYEEALQRQQSMMEELQYTKNVQLDYKTLYREKVINQKLKLKDQMLTNVHFCYNNKIEGVLSAAAQNFEKQARVRTQGRMNLEQMFTRNLRQLNRSEGMPKRKRLSIFHSQIISNQGKIEKMNEELNCSQKVWTHENTNAFQSFDFKAKPSLSLRLFRRIL